MCYIYNPIDIMGILLYLFSMAKQVKLPMHLQYWRDGAWFVGELLEVPGVMSQGATLHELEENILDAYQLVLEERRSSPPHSSARSIPIAVPA